MIALRRAAAVACCLVGVAALFGGVFARWLDRELFDTERFAARTTAVLRLGSVESALEERLVDRIRPAVVPEARPLVAPAVSAVIADPRFTTILDEAIRSAHSALVGSRDGPVVLDLSAATGIIRGELAAVDPLAAASIGDLDDELRLVIAGRADLPGGWGIAERLHRAGVAMIVLAGLLVALALVIGPDRWLVVLIGGVGLTIGGAVVQLGAGSAGRAIDASIRDRRNRQAARDVTALFVDPLRAEMTTVMIVGAVVALIGVAWWLLRPRPPGKAQRAMITPR